MFPPWHPFLYIILSVLALIIVRLLLHLLVKVVSNKKIFPLKLRVDKNFDFIEGWRTGPENSNGDDEKDYEKD